MPSLVRQPETLADPAVARRRRTAPRTRVGSVNFSLARGPRMGLLMDGLKREAYLYSYCGQSFPGLSRASGGMRPWIGSAHEGGHLPVRTVTVLPADRTGCHHDGDPAGLARRGFGGDLCGSGPQRP